MIIVFLFLAGIVVVWHVAREIRSEKLRREGITTVRKSGPLPIPIAAGAQPTTGSATTPRSGNTIRVLVMLFVGGFMLLPILGALPQILAGGFPLTGFLVPYGIMWLIFFYWARKSVTRLVLLIILGPFVALGLLFGLAPLLHY